MSRCAPYSTLPIAARALYKYAPLGSGFVLMARVYLVRHGESAANIDAQVHHQQYDPPLSAAGEQQARDLARWAVREFPPDARVCVVVSPLLRARQTAQPVVDALQDACELRVEYAPLCREQCNARSDCMSEQDYDAHQNETVAQLLARCAAFRAELHAHAAHCDVVLVVTHSRFMQFFVHGTYAPVPANAVPLALDLYAP